MPKAIFVQLILLLCRLQHTLPAQLVSELVQLLLSSAQLRLQILSRGVELVLQQLQLVRRVGKPLP